MISTYRLQARATQGLWLPRPMAQSVPIKKPSSVAITDSWIVSQAPCRNKGHCARTPAKSNL
jgi:hypothetical protein